MTKATKIILTLLTCSLNSIAQSNSDFGKLILGKWKYDIAYDTIAVVDTSHFYKERPDVTFFTKITIMKDHAILFDSSEKWNATWDIKNQNELYFYLGNSKTLKYIITNLTSRNLELRYPDLKVSTLGYKR